MARTANLDALPSSNVSENDLTIIMGAIAKLFPVLRTAFDRSENMPENFNVSDLSQVKELSTRLFVVLANNENAKRKGRLSTLRDVVIGNPIVAASMGAAISARDAFAAIPEETRKLAGLSVPTMGKVDLATVKLAVSAAFPGITDTDLIRDLDKVGLKVEGTDRRGHVVQIPFDVFADRSAKIKARAEEAAAAANVPAKPSKASAKDAPTV